MPPKKRKRPRSKSTRKTKTKSKPSLATLKTMFRGAVLSAIQRLPSNFPGSAWAEIPGFAKVYLNHRHTVWGLSPRAREDMFKPGFKMVSVINMDSFEVDSKYRGKGVAGDIINYVKDLVEKKEIPMKYVSVGTLVNRRWAKKLKKTLIPKGWQLYGDVFSVYFRWPAIKNSRDTLDPSVLE
uniref:Uncharacterized protein n=1 Tax=viral metagenome TaxID=1070528 RepID=A0A6C0BPR0_9ZZZZ